MSKRRRKFKDNPAGSGAGLSTGDGRAASRAFWVAFFSFAAIMLLFFASGFSSLIYQVVWTRMLVLVFGATTFATSTSLAIFMGGLALGSFIAARYVDRLKRPFLWYGVLEGIIGLWALITPFMFSAATPFYKLVWQTTGASLIELSMVRFLCSALILILPTTCMGATLPLLARFVTDKLETVGSKVGALYAVNTLGAVAGAVATGFFILPAYGLSATLWIAAAINGLLLASVLILDRSREGSSEFASTFNQAGAPNSPDATDPTSHQKLPYIVKLSATVFAISGGIAMIYEVCWTRTLLMVVGSSTYAFTLMLAAFLTGIFLGSFICSRLIDRRWAGDPLLWFAVLQILVGGLTLASMVWFNQIPYLNLVINAGTGADSNLAMFYRFVIAGSILAPITFCLGAIFPAVVKACTTDLAAIGRSVGFLYSANTLGAIVGAFLAGFVCLPALGVEKTLITAAIANAALGLLLLWGAGRFSLRTQVVCTLCGIAFMSVFLRSADVWDKNILLNAQAQRRMLAFRPGLTVPSFDDWKKRIHDHSQVKFYADGTCSNVGLIYHPRTKITSLVTNGHIDASDDADMPVQALLGGLPLLFKPDAKELAVVGWGSGQTVGYTTLFPVSSIDAIELEPNVITASKAFHHVNMSPENDRRVHIHYNDGRNFLLATDKKYDVIVSEPSNPWQAGVCNLFTREYFAICKDRLKHSGVLSAWVQTAEIPTGNLCSILGALNSEFKYTVAFFPTRGNMIVLASQEPLQINLNAMQATITANEKRSQAFARVGIENAGDLLARLAISTAGMKQLSVGFLNTDDHNRLEFDVARSYENKLYVNPNMQMIIALNIEPWKQANWQGLSREQQAVLMANAAQGAMVFSADIAMEWAKQSVAVQPTAQAERLLAALYADAKDYATAEKYFSAALKLQPQDADLWMSHGNALCALGRNEEGRKDLEKSLQLAGGNTFSSRYLLAASYSADLVGMPALGATAVDKSARERATHVLNVLGDLPSKARYCQEKPGILLLAAQANFKLGQFDQAEKLVLNYKELVSKKEHDAADMILRTISQCRTRKS